MINLLQPETKQSIVYARRNRQLVHWVVGLACGLLGILVVLGAGLLYMNHMTSIYAKEVKQNQDILASQHLKETQKRIEDIGNSIKLVNQVLGREVLFSRLLQGIGAAMPTGASLQNLSIGKLDGGIDLQAVAVDYQTATQVQVNLQDPANKIFDKADIVSINCASASSGQKAQDSRYPCQVSIRASFAKNSPYLINNTATGAKK